jgi:hypothetical protein
MGKMQGVLVLQQQVYNNDYAANGWVLVVLVCSSQWIKGLIQEKELNVNFTCV